MRCSGRLPSRIAAALALGMGTLAAAVLEVMGPPGTVRETALPPAREGSVLWVRAQGINAPDRASVRVNGGPWIPLNNRQCRVEGIGAKLNGIGGPLNQLRFSVTKARLRADTTNRVEFRFSASDGNASGFRVLEVGGLRPGERMEHLRPEPPPVHSLEDPPEEAVRRGETLWRNAPLVVGWDKRPLRATCSGCHAHDGRDLRHFGYSDFSIVERSRFHGLATKDGEDIAAYIRSNDAEPLGRPWNPPYQPGPGLDSLSVDAWSAGAGWSSVPESDAETFAHLFKGSSPAFDFSGTINVRELPIAFALPEWNEWLPVIHPLDYWGDSVRPVLEAYERLRSAQTLRFASALTDAVVTFNQWRSVHGGPVGGGEADARYHQARASFARWKLIRVWDAMKTLGLEEYGRAFFEWDAVDKRSWPGQEAFMCSPHAVGVPETGHGIRDDSIVTVSCQSLQWYWLQLVLNDANHRRQDTSPIDWNYLVAFSAVPIRYGIPGEAMVITALAKAAEAGTGAPETRENAFFGFYGPRLEYLDHREFPHMWSTYPRERRDAIVGAFLAEYDGWIRKLGRDYFVKVTGEIDPADRDNTPGPPMAPPWIRSHAGVTAYFKDRKYPAEIQARMRDLGSFLWPDAAPGWR